MRGVNNEQKCILISFNNRKSRPLSGLPLDQNLVVESTLKKRAMSAISFEKKNATHNRHQSQAGFASKRTLISNTDQQKKPVMIGSMRDREQLYQQNLQLKKQINKNKNEITLLKSKIEVPPKPAPTELDIKFQKQLYWTGNKTYMVAGVKAQYAKLKEKYQKMQDQYNKLKVQLYETKHPETSIYMRELQVQNRRLLKSLQIAMSDTPISTNRQRTQMQILQSKIQELDIDLRSANESLDEKDRTIEFLEKRIIELGNKGHKISTAARKQNRKINQLQNEQEKLIEQIKTDAQKNKNKISYLEEQIKNRDKNEETYRDFIRKQVKAQIKKYSEKIKQFQEQITHLRIQRDTAKEQLQKYQQKQANNLLIQQSKGGAMKSMQSEMLRQTNYRVEKQDFEKISISNEQSLRSTSRQRKTGNQPISQNSVRKRRLKFFEIQKILELLPYRMMNSSILPDDVKELFNFAGDEGSEWQKEYITMRQVNQILSSNPFSLNQEQSQLISRFIIEDGEQDFIYVDPENQNSRLIVKSIIKNLVGTYTLIPEEAVLQLETMVKKNSSFLGKAISQAVKGSNIVSEKKLFEILKYLDIEMSEGCRQAILTRLCADSLSLNQLRYRFLFS